jgi:hypothetical protein
MSEIQKVHWFGIVRTRDAGVNPGKGQNVGLRGAVYPFYSTCSLRYQSITKINYDKGPAVGMILD